MGTGKRTLTLFVVFIAVCLLCFGSGYVGYTYNQYEIRVDEQNYNYKQGQSAGEKIGYDRGYLEGYKIGLNETISGYSRRDPTYQEMRDFLAEDDSDNIPYNRDGFICTDYSARVNNNAEEKGIRCGSVYIIYPETGHSIIAFDTTDKGLIFIEPQYDKEVKLKIGSSYSTLNGFLKMDDVDDTIVRYLIMW